MIGIHFYEQFKDEQKRESAGKAIAVFVQQWKYGSEAQGRLFDAVVGHLNRSNPPVVHSTVSERYLKKKCRRVSEYRAKEIHPNLFRLLDGR
jgi:hypothetical protein